MFLNKFYTVIFALTLLCLSFLTIGKSHAADVEYTSAEISWPAIRTATKYNIYYKEKSSDNWQYSVIGLKIPRTSPMMTYKINDLKKNTTYDYKVGAIKIKKEMVFYNGVVTVK